jgi:hypothetical protein
LKAAIDKLQSSRLRQLLAFRSSDAALDRVVSSLFQKKVAIEKFEAIVSESNKRCTELSQQLCQISDQSSAIIKQCKEAQTYLEAEMTTLFPGCSVRLVGEINQLE